MTCPTHTDLRRCKHETCTFVQICSQELSRPTLLEQNCERGCELANALPSSDIHGTQRISRKGISILDNSSCPFLPFAWHQSPLPTSGFRPRGGRAILFKGDEHASPKSHDYQSDGITRQRELPNRHCGTRRHDQPTGLGSPTTQRQSGNSLGCTDCPVGARDNELVDGAF